MTLAQQRNHVALDESDHISVAVTTTWMSFNPEPLAAVADWMQRERAVWTDLQAKRPRLFTNGLAIVARHGSS